MTEQKHDLEQRISDPEIIFARTRDEAFTYVVAKLQEHYVSADDQKKLEILQELIKTSKVSHQVFNLFASPKPSFRESSDYAKIRTSPYDPKIARAIREKLGITRRELARQLGFTEHKDIHANANYVQHYEAGIRIPGKYPRGKFAPKYFQWLKDNGYDPFNFQGITDTSSEIQVFPSLEYDGLSKITKFDRRKARKIRRGQGLSQKNLVELLGFGNYSPSTLSFLETGTTKVTFPPKTALVANYLFWLKDHGYNPFGILTKKPEVV